MQRSIIQQVNSYERYLYKRRVHNLAIFLLLVSLTIITYVIWTIVDRIELVAFIRPAYLIDQILSCISGHGCHPAVHDFLYSTALLSMHYWLLVAFLIFFVAFALSAYAKAIKDYEEPGLARWANKEDILPFVGQPGYLGVAHNKLLGYPDGGNTLFTHTLVLGRPGSGKTASVLEPQFVKAIEDGHSVIVVEQKYPNVNGFPKYFEWIEKKLGAGAIQVFAPADPRSYTFPILDPVKNFASALELAYAFYPKLDDEHPAAFHYNRERPVLANLLYLEAVHGEGNMANVYNLTASGHQRLHQHFKQALETGQLTPEQYDQLTTFFNLSNNEKATALTGLNGRLEAFSNPVIAANFARSDYQIDFSRIANQQGVLYIAMPESLFTTGAGVSLLGIINLVIQHWLVRAAEENVGRLKNPTVVFYDEFPNFREIPGITHALRTMRERRVAYILAAQTLASLYEHYPKPSADAIIATVGVHFLTSKTAPQDVLELQALVGERTTVDRSEGYRHHPIDTPTDHTLTHQISLRARSMLSPDLFTNLPLGTAVVLAPGHHPILSQIPLLDNRSRPHAGRHPATDPLFNPVRRHLPDPEERTPERFWLYLLPYFKPTHAVTPAAAASPASQNTRAKPQRQSTRPSQSQPLPEGLARILEQKPAASDTPPPTSPPAQEESQPQQGPPIPPAAPRMRENDTINALAEWMEGLEPFLPATELTHDLGSGKITGARLRINPFARFPLPPENALAAAQYHRLIKAHSDRDLELLAKLARKLSPAEANRLERWALLTTFLNWARKNPQNVAPDSKLPPNERYQATLHEGALLVTKEAAKDAIFGGVQPEAELLKRRGVEDPGERLRLQVLDRRRVYRIPLPEEVYNNLKAFLQQHHGGASA